MDEEACDLGGRSNISKRFKLRLANFIAAKATSYSDPTAPSKMLELKHLDTKVMVYMTLLQGRVVFEAVQ